MPSFFSKVFGRKKDGRGSPLPQGRTSDGSLLDGNFEAVSPVNTPSVAEFPENALRGNSKEKGVASGLFKVKSQPSRSYSSETSKRGNLPQLSLALPVPKDDAQACALGVVFEVGPDAQILTDDAIGKKILTPSEALILVRACSQAITARGLETLGLMHPHWYSASPDVQRRLISLFIHSLNPNNAITILPPSLSSSSSLFESEIKYTRSPHDVAAVLRWGLRHLELNGENFGKNEHWYRTFSEAERNSEYLPGSYSKDLASLIPPDHLELLNAILDLFSSLAAHAERNSTSASKLTRVFGFWLLAAPRVGEDVDWSKFYARWQEHGRILEHLFLARIRDESLRLRMPTRLTELVVQYPYVKGATPASDVFLPPRASTRYFDALFVRVETEFSSPQDQVHCHPLQFLKDALAADVVVGESESSTLWEKIRNIGNDENSVLPGGLTGLSQAFADETIRYLALVPGGHPLKRVASSTLSITKTPQQIPDPRWYVSSPGPPEAGSSDQVLNGATLTNGYREPIPDPSSLPSAPKSILPTDWAQFSSAGFSDVSTSLPLASTLLGQDVKKTNPPLRKASRHSTVPSPSRSPSEIQPKSVHNTIQHGTSNLPQSEPSTKLPSKSFPLSVVEIDEAFIEFWVDALLDPIASVWRKFVICKLRPSLSELTIDHKRVQYLVVEHAFVPKPMPIPPLAEVAQSQPIEMTRAVSMDKSTVASSLGRLSVSSEKNRFFGFFSSSGRHTSYGSSTPLGTKGKKKIPPAHYVNDLDEVLEDPDGGKTRSSSSAVKLKMLSPQSRRSVDELKSVRIPKQVAKDDKEASEKEEKEKKEKKGLSSDVGIAATGAAVIVADAAVMAPASAVAKEKDNAAVITLSPTTDTSAAEGSQFVQGPVSGMEYSTEENSMLEESAMPNPLVSKSSSVSEPETSVPEHLIEMQDAALNVPTTVVEPMAKGLVTQVSEEVTPGPVEENVIANCVEEPKFEAAVAEAPVKVKATEVSTLGVETVIGDLEGNTEAIANDSSIPVPASEEAPATLEHVSVEESTGVVEQAVPVVETFAPASVEESTYEQTTDKLPNTPKEADSVSAVPVSEIEETTLTVAFAEAPSFNGSEPVPMEDDVTDDNDNSPMQQAISEETTILASEEPIISVADGSANTIHSTNLDEVAFVTETLPTAEEPVATADIEPVVEAPRPETLKQTVEIPGFRVGAPIVEATDEGRDVPGPSMQLEVINKEGAPSAAETSHDVEEPVENITAIQGPASEPLTDAIEKIEQDSVGSEEVVPTKHVDAEYTIPDPVPVPDPVIPLKGTPEKLVEVVDN